MYSGWESNSDPVASIDNVPSVKDIENGEKNGNNRQVFAITDKIGILIIRATSKHI